MHIALEKNHRLLQAIKYLLLVYSGILILLFRESNFSLYSSLIAACVILVAVVLTLAIRSGLDSAINTFEHLYQNYSYLKYDLSTKVFYLSGNLMHSLKFSTPLISSLDELSIFIDNETIEKINHTIDISQKTRRIETIPLVQINHTSSRQEYFRCEIYTIYSQRIPVSVIVTFVNITNEHSKILSLKNERNIANSKISLMSNILDHIPLAVWVRNQSLDIIYFNKYYTQLVIQPNKMLDATSLEIDKLAKNLAKLVFETKKTRKDERYIISGGKRHLYQFIDTYANERDEVVSIAFDITAKDLIKHELQRSIEAQSDLLESTSNACAIFGPDRKLRFFNQAYVNLWELESKWLEEGPLYEHILDKLLSLRKIPEQANFTKFKKDQINLFTNLTETHNDFFYLPDGRSIRVIVIPHAFGGLLFSYEDMTDRLALESSYNTLIHVQKATLDNLHEGICVFGENGRLKLINPVFTKMWKLGKDYLDTNPHIIELIDTSGYLFNNLESLNIHKAKLVSVLTRRTSAHERIERSDGSVISRIIVPLPDGATLVSDLDMTDSIVVERSLREKNNALQDADRIKSEFFANVSYELRSPLTSIIGLSEVLVRNYFGDLNIKQTEYLKDIMNAAKQLMDLINDIIDLTFVDAGYIELNIKEFNINNSVQSVMPLIKERLRSMQIDCNVTCPASIGTMVGDENRIKQVIFKLLSNSIAHSNYGGKIEVYLRGTEDSIYLSVTDNGKGISADDQPYIFDKFYKIKDVQKNSVNPNNGLGLSIVKTFVELHGGELHFESVKNLGSKFECRFPRKHPEIVAIYNSYEKEIV
jgi:signal transduction histidine kinase/CxxC motif-containing protein